MTWIGYNHSKLLRGTMPSSSAYAAIKECSSQMFNCIQLNSRTKSMQKKSGHTTACIEEDIPTNTDGKDKCFICLTYVRHMKNKKIPPMSVKNGLKLAESDNELKEQKLEITEYRQRFCTSGHHCESLGSHLCQADGRGKSAKNLE